MLSATSLCIQVTRVLAVQWVVRWLVVVIPNESIEALLLLQGPASSVSFNKAVPIKHRVRGAIPPEHE